MSLLPTQFDDLFSSMVAGSVPLHSGDVEQSIVFMARDVLNSGSIHFLIREHKETRRAYYFAVPSVALRSSITPRTPLAAAIPGHPDHKGNGVYLLQMEPMAAAAIFQDGDLRLVVNSSEVLMEYLEELDLPIFEVAEAESWPFESDRTRYRATAEVLSKRVVRYSAIATVIAVAVIAALNVSTGLMKKQTVSRLASQEEEFRRVVTSFSAASPLASQLTRFQDISAAVVSSGGWIDNYRMSSGNEAYKVYVPPFVGDETMKKLGVGFSTIREGEWLVVTMDKIPKAKTGGQRAQGGPNFVDTAARALVDAAKH